MNLPTTTHLTLEEEYRITGTLSPKRIEGLLDTNDQVQEVLNFEGSIHDAMCSFPDEDFMNPVVHKLHSMIKSARGHNREQLRELLQIVEDISTEIVSSAEYGRGELRSVIDSIQGIKGGK